MGDRGGATSGHRIRCTYSYMTGKKKQSRAKKIGGYWKWENDIHIFEGDIFYVQGLRQVS